MTEQNGKNSEITNYGSWKEWGIFLVQQVKSMSRGQDKLESKLEDLGVQLKDMDTKFEDRFDSFKLEFVEEITKLKERTNRQSTFYGILGGAIGMIVVFIVKYLLGGK